MTDVKNATPGRWRDPKSRNLYLDVKAKGIYHWTYRYTRPSTKKKTETGLGPLLIDDARAKARELAAVVAKGIDPVEAKREARASGTTFGECFKKWKALQESKWKDGLGRVDTYRNHKMIAARVTTAR